MSQKAIVYSPRSSMMINLKQSVSSEQAAYDDPEEAAQQVIRIARKPQVMRTDFETQILMNSLRNIKFFREQFDQHYEEMLEDVCEHARIVMMVKGETVFLQDTTGDTFYIIIKGQIKIVKKVSYMMGQIKNKKGVMVDHYVEQTKHLTTLAQGDSFGELSLIEKKPRAATAICESDSYFLVLDKDSFTRIIATKAKRQFMHLLEKLRENSILRELSNNTVKALFLVMERIQFKYGDYVYHQNQPSESIYFVSQGEFRLQQETLHTESDEGGERETSLMQTIIQHYQFKIAGANECIGLEDFINGGVHQSQAICNSQEGVLFKLDRVDYHRLENRYPDICQIMISVAKEKSEYYAERTQQVSQIKKSITAPESSRYADNVTNTKQLRKIITEDQDMSFIYRDQITLNEDNDILMKFSRFFQIEAKTQPFQVNTVEQIQKNRVQSAGYRTLVTSTHIPQPQRPNVNTTAKTQRRTTSALGQQNESVQKRKKVVRTRSHKVVLQEKVQNFLQMNLDSIIKQSRDTLLNRAKTKESKPYIKPYRNRQMEQFVDCSNIQGDQLNSQVITIHSPDKSYFAATSSRPETGKRPQIHHEISPISQTFRQSQSKINQSSFRGSTTNDTIHNYHERSGVQKFSRQIKDTMSMVQVPLKYHSKMIKVGTLCSYGFQNSKPRHHSKNRNLINKYFGE